MSVYSTIFLLFLYFLSFFLHFYFFKLFHFCFFFLFRLVLLQNNSITATGIKYLLKEVCPMLLPPPSSTSSSTFSFSTFSSSPSSFSSSPTHSCYCCQLLELSWRAYIMCLKGWPKKIMIAILVSRPSPPPSTPLPLPFHSNFRKSP